MTIPEMSHALDTGDQQIGCALQTLHHAHESDREVAAEQNRRLWRADTGNFRPGGFIRKVEGSRGSGHPISCIRRPLGGANLDAPDRHVNIKVARFDIQSSFDLGAIVPIGAIVGRRLSFLSSCFIANVTS
jgi:hypothetical protein